MNPTAQSAACQPGVTSSRRLWNWARVEIGLSFPRGFRALASTGPKTSDRGIASSGWRGGVDRHPCQRAAAGVPGSEVGCRTDAWCASRRHSQWHAADYRPLACVSPPPADAPRHPSRLTLFSLTNSRSAEVRILTRMRIRDPGIQSNWARSSGTAKAGVQRGSPHRNGTGKLQRTLPRCGSSTEAQQLRRSISTAWTPNVKHQQLTANDSPVPASD